MTAPLLEVSELSVDFNTERGPVRAVDKLSFDLAPGETLGLVGESGCGKTVSALAILGLIPPVPRGAVSGSIRLNGRDLLGLPEKLLRHIRGRDISMIFQEPMSALNPVFSIAEQMTDVLRRHQGLGRKQALRRAIEMLEMVSIPSPARRIQDYPHELSGGMRQRVMIAMALSCNPKVLIADEPTTALDVTTQAQVLEQIKALQNQLGTAVVFITHDLGVIAEVCGRALVMYCGRVLEQAGITELFGRPLHPYTAGLLRAIPRIRNKPLPFLPAIPGAVPDLLDLPGGCHFADRCEYAQPRCEKDLPMLETQADKHYCACHFPLRQNESGAKQSE